jgi:hypothetical protein
MLAHVEMFRVSLPVWAAQMRIERWLGLGVARNVINAALALFVIFLMSVVVLAGVLPVVVFFAFSVMLSVLVVGCWLLAVILVVVFQTGIWVLIGVARETRLWWAMARSKGGGCCGLLLLASVMQTKRWRNKILFGL